MTFASNPQSSSFRGGVFNATLLPGCEQGGRMNKFRRYHKGQIAVVLTLTMATLLGAVALGADVAVLYFNWVQIQKAADGAVLAGANYLPGNPSQAQSVAQSYAAQNGVATSEIVSTTVASDDMSMTMLVSRSVPYNFARVLGLTTGLVKVSATAGIQQNPEMGRGLIPVGLPCTSATLAADGSNCSYAPGTEYQLVQAGANGNGGSWNVGPGNWGRLALGAPGASMFLQNLELGYEGSININQAVNAQTGQVNGPTDMGVTDRVTLGQAEDSNPPSPSQMTLSTVLSNDAWQYDPRLVAVPLVDFTSATGNSVQVPVVGFAMMWLDSYTAQGPNKTLNAYFLGSISAGEIPYSISEFGTLTPILMG
jgi:Flp pilus assembly protein TadG